MKIFVKLSLAMIAFFPLMSMSRGGARSQLDAELARLDVVIANRETYIAGREQRIRSLKKILETTEFSDDQRVMLNQQLIDEYVPYQVDSAIEYLYSNIALCDRLGNRSRVDRSRIQLSYLYSSAGIYLEAANLLDRVDTAALCSEGLVKYYIARHKLNDELLLYSRDTLQKRHSWQLAEYYARQIVENTDSASMANVQFRLWQAIDRKDYDLAVEYADRFCAGQQPLTRDYAIAAHMRALVADRTGDRETAQIWYARAAATDIQLAIRDNSALKSLSITLLDYDVTRAMRYVRVVMDDARFFNSWLRPWQDMTVMYSIEKAYMDRQQRVNVLYNIVFLSIGIFLLLAFGGLLFFRRQNRKLNVARLQLQQANAKLNESNAKLNESNDNLQRFNEKLLSLNDQLSESNEVKEEYIGIFLTMCSEYIDKIMGTRRHVRRMLVDGRIAELRKEYSSPEPNKRELDEFYHNFDTTFLHLYPTFIEDFNSLLDSEARIKPKKGELLTTELRIFALIRLGIRDSSKIAALLRYSTTTIYNYRSKIKNYTVVSREDFEERIKTIGAFNPQHH